jgi:phosphatidyl-myo-inositol alpha-mannosyltransferase
MKRIVFVCPYDLSRPGGVRTHIYDLAGTLQQKGHEVCIIGSASEPNSESEIPLINLGRAIKTPIWGTDIDISRLSKLEIRQLRQYFLRFKPDVIHFHTPWTPFLSWQILRLAHRMRKSSPSGSTGKMKLVATFHDSPPDSFLGDILGRFVMPGVAKYFLNAFDKVISVSEHQKQFIAKWSQKTIHIIPNGIVLGDIAKSPSPEDPKILFLGRLEPRKGVMHMLEVYIKVLTKIPQARLVIAGDGPDRKSAETFVRVHQLKNVRFLGRVDNAEKEAAFRSASVFVSPALYGESFGIVLLEAMTYGIPIAGFGNPGYLSVVGDLCPENFPSPGDNESLANRIIHILQDETYSSRLISSYQHHLAMYDWDILADKILAVYETS